MNIVQLTPGAGKMYCGNCFRDNAMVKELRRMGHETLMMPLYLPLTLEDEDATEDTPIFFNGIRVFLEQKSAVFRRAPKFIHELVSARRFLDFAAGKAPQTRADQVGELAVSMLRGEEGNQARELDQLVAYLLEQGQPDVVCISNSMLLGLARRIKSELNVPIVCMLQGEHAYVESMQEAPRKAVWELMAERAKEVDLFVAPSRYFADLMNEKLKVPESRIKVIYNGIDLTGYTPATSNPPRPVLGYFARMCKDKGLDVLVDAFLKLKTRNQVEGLKLWIGGGCGPGDEPFVAEMRDRLNQKGWISDVEYYPNLSREDKLEFYRRLSVLSVPSSEGEAFGLYIAEAMASGVPVVQPNHSAFPELIELTGGGVVADGRDANALAAALEPVLMAKKRTRELGDKARAAAEKHFTVNAMATQMVEAFKILKRPNGDEIAREEPSTLNA
jgi:glycosyltransferase involved in cell wall biosynthesis